LNQEGMKQILLLEGPNLNMVGIREPNVYGHVGIDFFLPGWREKCAALGVTLVHLQTNHEGGLIDALQTTGMGSVGVVFNPGGYTHTSVALRDAVAAIGTPVVEVHLSNIHSREDFRRVSMLSEVSAAVVSGLGYRGYEAAMDFLLHR
jgi:3-dehydroquinate dehydratase-2